MRRVPTLVLALLVVAACGQSGTTSTTTIDPPWTTVPVPTTQPIVVTSDAIEVQSVCVSVEAEGVVDGPSIEEGVGLRLAVLGLGASPGDACDADFVVSAAGERICARYYELGVCCGGLEIEGRVVLEVNGQRRYASPIALRSEPPLTASEGSGQCPAIDSVVTYRHFAIRDPVAASVDRWFGLPNFETRDFPRSPSTVDVFWRLMAALHNEDRFVRYAAAEHLEDWVKEWDEQGRPGDGVPFTEAVPHLLLAMDLTWRDMQLPIQFVGVLEEITLQSFPREADWWEWWVTASES